MSLIYKITNDVNGKIYVGKTEYSEDIRFKQHINDSKKDRCKNRPFYKAINMEANIFIWKKLKIVKMEILLAKEKCIGSIN